MNNGRTGCTALSIAVSTVELSATSSLTSSASSSTFLGFAVVWLLKNT
jgi:hypothetical protein